MVDIFLIPNIDNLARAWMVAALIAKGMDDDGGVWRLHTAEPCGGLSGLQRRPSMQNHRLQAQTQARLHNTAAIPIQEAQQQEVLVWGAYA
jgi:hypothetical protein